RPADDTGPHPAPLRKSLHQLARLHLHLLRQSNVTPWKITGTLRMENTTIVGGVIEASPRRNPLSPWSHRSDPARILTYVSRISELQPFENRADSILTGNMSAKQLHDKTALITGGAGGIGRATAL